MRFPRALGIRDDLTVADCVTATGAYTSPLSARFMSRRRYVSLLISALFESVRSERKRKREEEMSG